jgi:hypothetical protein
MSRHQIAGQNSNAKTAEQLSKPALNFGPLCTSFEGVAKFKFTGMTLTNQNYIYEEIKSRFKSGKVCYHSAQNLSPRPLPRNVKINENFWQELIAYFP